MNAHIGRSLALPDARTRAPLRSDLDRRSEAGPIVVSFARRVLLVIAFAFAAVGRAAVSLLDDYLMPIASYPVDVLIGSIGTRRGFQQPICEICRDVHDVGEPCPKQQIGECDVCACTVGLDRWGNCEEAGDRWRDHRISHRRLEPRRWPRLVECETSGAGHSRAQSMAPE